MKKKVCLITGATSGIGLETSIALAKKNFDLILISRSENKLNKLSANLLLNFNINVKTYKCDLSSIKETKKLSWNIVKDFTKIDVVINNVGAIFMSHQLNSEGIEMTLALNHLSYFTLTNMLLDNIENTDNMRIINVSSNAHRRTSIDTGNLEMQDCYNGWLAYKKSKLANIYFTYYLSNMLKDSTVTVNCLHPGLVNSNFANNTEQFHYKIAASLIKLFGISNLEGAQTSIYLASDDLISNITGKYFYKCRPIKSSAISLDQDIAKKLWGASESLINNV